jgi:cell wall-associated NlpC family hydrolase
MLFHRVLCVLVLAVPIVACASSEEKSDGEDDDAKTSQDALVGGCGPDRLIANAPADKKAILQRAAKWVRDPVPYSMEDWKDGHRTDCSGFVSMAWGRSDFTTAQVPPRSSSSSIARKIEWDDLQVGDAVARGPWPTSEVGHIMLYAGTDYMGFACFWEQTHGGTRTASFVKTWLTTSEYVAIRER